jgi:3-deoxy-D-manno-octulosonic-acid transferase
MPGYLKEWDAGIINVRIWVRDLIDFQLFGGVFEGLYPLGATFLWQATKRTQSLRFHGCRVVTALGNCKDSSSPLKDDRHRIESVLNGRGMY